MKTKTLLRYAISICAGLGISGMVHAQDWKVTGEFGWFGVGKAQEIEKGHFYWVGEFSGTFFNDKGEGSPFHRAGVKCPAWFDADFNHKKSKAGGYCIITDLGGDQAYLTWQNAGTPEPGATAPVRSSTRGAQANTKGSAGITPL